MKSSTGSIVSLVLVLMATSSLISMISTLKIDAIVHGDLYRYGLQFSYGWALPYWTLTILVFAMGWFNIITAIAFQLYVLTYGRKEALGTEISKESEPQPQPTKEEIIEIETKPTEKIEEHEEQATEQATEPLEEAEKKPEETQTVVEDTSQPEQTETIPAEEAEEQKEQEPKTAEESEVETKETSTPATETEQETQEKSEETPLLVGVPEEEPQATTEDTQQQVGASLS